MVQYLWKTVCQFLKNLNMELLDDPEILLQGLYPRELKTYASTRTYTWMFIAAVFKIAKSGNNANPHQLINLKINCGIIHTME